MGRMTEYMTRGIQMVVGAAIFDVPGLYSIRRATYHALFPIGRRGSILRHVMFTRPHMMMGGTIEIGDDVGFNHDVEIDYTGGVVVEDDVWFSQNILIETHEHVYEYGKRKKDWKRTTSPLRIRRGAWIGANVTILGQVTEIGENTIVGGGSVVTKNVPDNAIVGGNPARVLRDMAEAAKQTTTAA
jgi:hypothetical protein